MFCRNFINEVIKPKAHFDPVHKKITNQKNFKIFFCAKVVKVSDDFIAANGSVLSFEICSRFIVQFVDISGLFFTQIKRLKIIPSYYQVTEVVTDLLIKVDQTIIRHLMIYLLQTVSKQV